MPIFLTGRSFTIKRLLLLFGIGLLLIVVVLVAVRLIDRYLPYQPTVVEAKAYVLAQEGRTNPLQTPWGDDYKIVTSDVEIIAVVSDVPETQMIFRRITQTVWDDQEVIEYEQCVYSEYITRHWLSGPRAYAGFGSQCRSPQTEAMLRSLRMQSYHERGTVAVTGMVIDDRIHQVKAHWQDGLEMINDLDHDAFLFFRPDNVAVVWVAGLDRQGRVLSDTITHNQHLHFTPLDYDALQQVVMKDGVVILGGYAFSGVPSQTCLEVTYLTLENAQKFLRDEEAFIGQRSCIIDAADNAVIGPTVITLIEEDHVISGRILDDTVVAVRLYWNDSVVQVEPLLNDAFFFVRRSPSPGLMVSIDRIQGLDADGNVVTP